MVRFDDDAAKALASDLGALFQRFPVSGRPNESKPKTTHLGGSPPARWHHLSVIRISRSRTRRRAGRPSVRDAQAKARANGFPEEWKRYEFGLAIVESKRWDRPLDRQSGRRGEETAPSTQMLRYLRRVDDLAGGNSVGAC